MTGTPAGMHTGHGCPSTSFYRLLDHPVEATAGSGKEGQEPPPPPHGALGLGASLPISSCPSLCSSFRRPQFTLQTPALPACSGAHSRTWALQLMRRIHAEEELAGPAWVHPGAMGSGHRAGHDLHTGRPGQRVGGTRTVTQTHRCHVRCQAQDIAPSRDSVSCVLVRPV